ncbi:MAG TPA: hypothetical protein VGM08_02245 [Candidatus Saccharimonadales bacterium]|jgi:hypothetical protein
MANFTGTLLRRKHELGEKFVQLVFRDNGRDVLCISTNLRTAALPVGQPYRVKGAFTHRGEQAFMLDPKIADPKRHWRTVRRAMLAVLVLSCMSGAGGAAYLRRGSARHHAAYTTPAAPAGVEVSTY